MYPTGDTNTPCFFKNRPKTHVIQLLKGVDVMETTVAVVPFLMVPATPLGEDLEEEKRGKVSVCVPLFMGVWG